MDALSKGQRMQVARLTGAVARLTRGRDQDLGRAAKLAAIRAISTDPQVIERVMGPLLDPVHDGYEDADAEAVELLRAAGA